MESLKDYQMRTFGIGKYMADKKRYKILLVEDDELDVISVQRSLRELDEDYELFTAYNGKEALNMLINESLVPDVILLDLNMPKMNGTEFLKALRADESLRNLRVFIMTTSTDSQDRQLTQTLGISGYILKPLNYDNNSKRSDSMDAFVQFHLRRILSENT